MSDNTHKRVLNEAAAGPIPSAPMADWVWRVMKDYVIPCAQVGERWAVQIVRTGILFPYASGMTNADRSRALPRL